MEIVCLDMEGTLTPEIWEQVALNTGIDDLGRTTRDIPDYGELMRYRIKIMKDNGIKIDDIQKASNQLDLLPGALDFINEIRENFQIVILSDTFHQVASPLMKKLGHPLLLCHNLSIDTDGNIVDFNLRADKAKKQAIEAFNAMGYRCFAAGDSHNDIQMFEVAEQGFFINAPEKISSSYPHIPAYNNYSDLKEALLNHSNFVK